MINLKKQDSIADAVKEILQQEALKGNQHKIDKNKNNKIDAEDFKLLRKEENVDEALKGNQHKIDKNKNNKIDAEDFKLLRKEDTVEENAFDYKSPRQPEPNGGSGVKKGTRYGGSKQKEKPEQETDAMGNKLPAATMKNLKREETSYFKERLIEKAMLKMVAKKAFKALTGGSDEDQLKALQKRAGAPVTGKKPEPKNEEVEQVQEVSPPGFEGTVKAMKKYKKIDNPFALAWSMKNKGYKSHKKADGSDK
jgi:hypothetical protein